MEKIRIGVNATPLQIGGGGMKQHFIDTFAFLLDQEEYSYLSYIFYTLEAGLEVLNSIPALKESVKRGQSKIVQISNPAEIVNQSADFDLYYCPLNNFRPRILDKPSVAILADILEHIHPEFVSPGELDARKKVYPDIAKSVTRLITISQYSKSTISEIFGLKKSKIDVVYPDTAKFYTLEKEPKEKPSKEVQKVLDKKFIFYPANSYTHKNHKVLIRALGLVKDKGEDLSLVLTGKTTFDGLNVKAYAKRYGVQDRIYELGFLTQTDLYPLFKYAHALIFPSLFEGFGIPPIEAYKMDCPVICSDIPCLREVASKYATYFDPYSADDIAAKLIDSLHKEYVPPKDKQEHLSKFDAKPNVAKLVRIFHEAIKSHSGVENQLSIKNTSFAILRKPGDENHYQNSIKSIKSFFKGEPETTDVMYPEGSQKLSKTMINESIQKTKASGKQYMVILKSGQEILPSIRFISPGTQYVTQFINEEFQEYLLATQLEELAIGNEAVANPGTMIYDVSRFGRGTHKPKIGRAVTQINFTKTPATLIPFFTSDESLDPNKISKRIKKVLDKMYAALPDTPKKAYRWMKRALGLN